MRIILPRALRYAPFSANTGLYWLRSNLRTRYFMNVVLHSFDLMLEWRSHQHVVDMLLIEMVSRMGLHVEILPQRLFAIGQAYHHDPAFMEGMRNETHLPYVFHWSWTSGKDEKLKFARETGMWLLGDGWDVEGLASAAKRWHVTTHTTPGAARAPLDCCAAAAAPAAALGR